MSITPCIGPNLKIEGSNDRRFHTNFTNVFFFKTFKNRAFKHISCFLFNKPKWQMKGRAYCPEENGEDLKFLEKPTK